MHFWKKGNLTSKRSGCHNIINLYVENFTNTTIDTTTLPRFEEVQFTKLHPAYWHVLLLNLAIFFVIASVALSLAMFFNDHWREYMFEIGTAFIVFFGLLTVFTRLSFVKKGYAFRTHDVLFQSGVISTTTVIVPYNRVQHVALHEGLIPRYFDLAEIHIFTAGGSGSDLEIPGIPKEEAENIKQLLMGKIKKEL